MVKRRYLFAFILCLVFSSVILVFGVNYGSTAFAQEIRAVDYSEILRGARSNVNREVMSVNIGDDGVSVGGVFEPPSKALAKVAVREGVAFTENFTVESETVYSDDGVTMDLGFVYGDIDEAWLEPWDFLGINLSDAGSLAKFKSIGGFTVRFSLKGNSAPTLCMKGSGENESEAAFALAGVTAQVPYSENRDVSFVKEDGNWRISSCGTVLTFESNATKLTPSGSQNAQEFVNTVLNAALGRNVYAFIALEGRSDGSSAEVKIKSIGGAKLVSGITEDALNGDVSYEKTPEKEIEFSLIENYYIVLPEYADRNFTYLSQAYMDPSYEMTENGLKISGRDKLYGINGDLTYTKPFAKFDGFTAVLSAGDMPKTTSAVNSNVSLTLSGKEFESYYAWNSVYIRITFPFDDVTKGYNATVYLWGEWTGNSVLTAEMPITRVPYLEGGDIVIKIAELNGDYYIYINGVRFGEGYEDALKSTVNRIETGYTDADGEHSGFFVSTMNTTAYFANGFGLSDAEVKKTPNHYIKQIGGMAIVNKIPQIKVAERPYLPSEKDVTPDSITLSFSAETPDRTDGNFTVDGYVAERYFNGALQSVKKIYGRGNRTFTDSGLCSDKYYTYRIYAVSGVGSDDYVKLVEYRPITVKTLKVTVTASENGAKGIAGFIVGAIGTGAGGLLIFAFVLIFGKKRRGKVRAETPVTDRTYIGGRKPKRFITAICIILAVCLAAGGCAERTKGGETVPTDNEVTVVEKFIDSFENYVTPAWRSGVMYNETVLMQKGEDGTVKGKLAFAPLKVLSVKNYNLNVVYEEDKDYTVDGNGVITLASGSSCPFVNVGDLIYATRPQGVDGLNEFPSSTAAKPNIMYTETPYIVGKQICVTYEYDISQVKSGVFATADKDKLPALRNKLAQKKAVRLAVLGDSISQGANSSSTHGIEPYQPTYSVIFRQYLEKEFGVDVVFKNFSLGGQTSEWGVDRAYAAGQFMPDVVILSFGANDGCRGKDDSATPIPVPQFVNNLVSAMENVRKYNPNCEFIIVSSLMPNPDGAAFGIQGEYAIKTAERVAGDNSAIAVNMYKVHEYFVNELGKKYSDLTANNVNHPNDFLIRLYAQNIISALSL